MRIALENLASDRLDLSLDADRIIELAQLRGIGGTVERAEAVMQLRSVAVDSAVLEQLGIPLGTGGRLSTAKPAALRGLKANLDVRAGNDPSVPALTGTILGDELDAKAINLELPAGDGTLKVAGDLAAGHVNVTIDAKTGEVHGGSVSLRNLQLMVAGVVVRADRLSVTNLRVTWGGEHKVTVAIDTGELGDVRLRHGDIDVTLESLQLPAGFSLMGKLLELARLDADGIDVQIANLNRPRPPAPQPAATATPPGPPLTAWNVLNGLSGYINADVSVSAKVPVIGSRNATHHFRVPVSAGVINYAEVEDDLAGLEDAFIDFRVRGRRLVLERDVPIIPGLNKPIVTWDLDDRELELARRKLIPLATLHRAELASPPSKDDDEEPALVLRRLRVSNTDIELKLAPADEDGEHTTVLRGMRVDRLRVGGVIDHMPGTELESTPIDFDAEGIVATIQDLHAGSLRVAGYVQIGSIKDAILTMAGLAPSGLSGEISALGVGDLKLAFG